MSVLFMTPSIHFYGLIICLLVVLFYVFSLPFFTYEIDSNGQTCISGSDGWRIHKCKRRNSSCFMSKWCMRSGICVYLGPDNKNLSYPTKNCQYYPRSSIVRINEKKGMLSVNQNILKWLRLLRKLKHWNLFIESWDCFILSHSNLSFFVALVNNVSYFLYFSKPEETSFLLDIFFLLLSKKSIP